MASHPSPINGAHKGVIFGRERRSARRYGIHTPLSFSLSGSAPGKLTESYEIHNISETGLCVQFSSQMKVTRLLPVCLELSESGARIYAVGHVVWSEPSGKTGVHLPSISDSSRTHLQHWFETNSRAALSAESVIARIPELSFEGSVGPEASSGESSRLQKWAEAEHEIESCGPDFERVLQSIAQQAFALTSASGAAIALMSDSEPAEIVCRARAGTDAPEIGTRIEAGSGFSAECLRSGVTISCEDTENDERVDRASCRALGVRSIAAAPVKSDTQTIGIVEIFSSASGAFRESEIAILERLATLIDRAAKNIGRAAKNSESDIADVVMPSDAEQIATACPEKDASTDGQPELFTSSDSDLSPSRKIAWITAGATCLIVVLWLLAPTVARRFSSEKMAETSTTYSANPETYALVTFTDLLKRASAGETGAQYALGMRYANGIDVAQDYREAKEWFLRAAEQGDTRAQGKVAATFWEGKGGAQDYSKAYFWAVLAQAGGDEVSRQIVMSCAARLSPAQIAAEQKEANQWLHSHPPAQSLK